VRILIGDCRELLTQFPDNHFHCCVTSPPYWGLRDYGIEPVVWGGDAGCEHEWGDDQTISTGRNDQDRDTRHTDGRDPKTQGLVGCPKQTASTGTFCLHCSAWRGSLGLEPTPELYTQHLVEIFQEVHRVLRDDGTLWLNLGSSYWGGKGKSGHADPDYQAARVAKGESFSQVAAHVGGKGRTRPSDGSHPIFKPKGLVPIPWMVAMALQQDGWYLRSDIIWHKPNCMPESVRDRPTKSHEYLFLLSKSKTYYYDQDAVREPLAESTLADGRNATGRHTQGKNYSKYFDEASPDEAQPDKPSWYRAKTFVNPEQGRNRRTVWTIPTRPFKGAHFATFPPDLVEPCIKAGTGEKGCCPECGAPWERVVEKTTRFEGGSGKAGRLPDELHGKWGEKRYGKNILLGPVVDTQTIGWRPTCDCDPVETIPCRVLDPFAGAGTVGLVAAKQGRNATLLELNPSYAKLAQGRLLHELGSMFTQITITNTNDDYDTT